MNRVVTTASNPLTGIGTSPVAPPDEPVVGEGSAPEHTEAEHNATEQSEAKRDVAQRSATPKKGKTPKAGTGDGGGAGAGGKAGTGTNEAQAGGDARLHDVAAWDSWDGKRSAVTVDFPAPEYDAMKRQAFALESNVRQFIRDAVREKLTRS